MAGQEQPREDLLREATALIERVEMKLPQDAEPIVIGFRRNGSISFFLGPERVLQFNSRGELRRAYWSGRLIKAEGRQLHAMTRERSADEVSLHTRQLSLEQTREFLESAAGELLEVKTALKQRRYELLRQVPPERDILSRVSEWMEEHGDELIVADRPNAR